MGTIRDPVSGFQPAQQLLGVSTLPQTLSNQTVGIVTTTWLALASDRQQQYLLHITDPQI
jgi:hypothetical protein